MGKKRIKLISIRRENKLNNNDNIKSPKHYKLEGLNIESIDVIKATLGKEGFKSFCKGNIMKYLIRAERKNGLEDYKKAKTYLDWYLEECEEEKNETME